MWAGSPWRGSIWGGSVWGFEAQIRALFAAGEQGAWYDPSDLSTLYQDSAGTTPVTAVGQPVGRMLDKSGRGNHASQPTATARPTLQADVSGRKYLQFDGVDDFLVTPSIDFTATDKMTVVAGVRKESDAALAMLMELSTNSAVKPGSFYWLAPASGAGTYQWRSVGSTTPTAVDVSGFPAGVSHILTGIGGISTDTSIARVNGTQVGQSAADQGTGSYGNYPLYIGRRGGASLPFKGNLYSLLIRGALSTQAQIEAAERYANMRTGAY